MSTSKPSTSLASKIDLLGLSPADIVARYDLALNATSTDDDILLNEPDYGSTAQHQVHFSGETTKHALNPYSMTVRDSHTVTAASTNATKLPLIPYCKTSHGPLAGIDEHNTIKHPLKSSISSVDLYSKTSHDTYTIIKLPLNATSLYYVPQGRTQLELWTQESEHHEVIAYSATSFVPKGKPWL
ncbi:uncharacterized protein LY89DRAFT_726813 [Mollisia scopiformis]|uniref:Uncharacterized protein n=1 Tax=Mollisia scopiformis TaxID=149040 RepID=A0A194XU67_MOLSC|nr:uncharacterized protein LY89DRAFT_726813 [Mollisia scopiformis]KUJ23753.1 hypothetical protein LY89DRAFT_726813 [Mollisia scopiformis]